MTSIVRLSICVAIAGCGLGKKPETFPAQANAVLETEGKKQPWMGHVDPDLQPVDGKAGAWSPQSDAQLIYEFLAEGEICVLRKAGAQWFPSFGPVEKELEEYTALGRTAQIVFSVHDKLPEKTATTPWPARPSNTRFRISDHDVEKTPHVDEDQKTTYTYWLNVEMEWCAPTPVVTTSARYVTATLFRAEGVPALFVWAIDGTATPRGGGAAPVAPPEGGDAEPQPSPEGDAN